MKFSNQQIEAIKHKEGPALVLAVPGAGKTTVLLERIRYLLQEGVEPNRILAMTFSKSQAMDMAERFSSRSRENIHFSTIHSFTYGIVRKYMNNLGKDLRLIESSNEYNKYALLERLYYQVNKRRITDEDLETFFRVSGYIKNTLLDYEMYKKMYGPSIRNFEQIYELYERFKRENQLIDFDDMLVLALEILQENESILRNLQNRFEYIQIDEGQDTSLVQLKIIELIAKPNNNLFIVADDDQSIYGFRGADAKQLLNFQRLYPEAKIYLMEDNYRSTKNIVSMSNKVIQNNKKRYHKSIRHVHTSDDKINIIRAKNTKIQTNYVLKQALASIESGNRVAILYRNNLSAINLINAFDKDSPYYIKDGKLAFYSHFIVRDIIDILNFSKDNHDINSFERIYYKLNMYLKKDFIRQIKKMDPNRDVLENLAYCEGFNRFYSEKLELLEYYTRRIANAPFGRAVKIIIHNLGYSDYLEELSRRTKTPLINYSRLLDTIQNIANTVNDTKSFEDRLEFLKQQQKEHSLTPAPITLSTIHGSKGLEFDDVYMIDLINDEFPSAFSLKAESSLGMLEEERRLFYVGMTRAKKKLTLVSLKKLNESAVDISMFLKEITQ